MGYRIGSFNIRKFSRFSAQQNPDKITPKDIDNIGKILREGNFDIIAIQEILHKEALRELLERISLQYAEEYKGDPTRYNSTIDTYRASSRTKEVYGFRTKHWEGRWAKPDSSYGDKIAEGYAFIWNRDRIKLSKNSKGETFEPRISDFNGSNKLVRPPFLGRFMPINGSYEFRLINTHIVYATPSKKIDENDDTGRDESESEVDFTDKELRQNEMNTLIENIYKSYSVARYDVTGHDMYARPIPAYTFMLGDYNLNLGKSGSSSARIEELEELSIYINGNQWRPGISEHIVTVGDSLTTVKSKPKDDEKKRYLRQDPDVWNHLVNNYDHFSYDRNIMIDHGIADPSVGAFYNVFDLYEKKETDEDSKFDLYRDRVSDHIPIYLDMDVRKHRL